jgi:hydroxypyruvate reductase/glycerate 2-kinase
MGESSGVGESPPALAVPEIRNYGPLLTHGAQGPRALALRLARTGLAACDPAGVVAEQVTLNGAGFDVADQHYELHPEGRVVLLGSGKATLTIAAALERALGSKLSGGVVVVRHAAGPVLRTVQVVEASHPIPDSRSHAAARVLLATASELTARDILIACFTGGSSALTSLPPEGVMPEEKAELHRQLLSVGMPITEVNTVRKQVSAIKGGRLAKAAGQARIINLTVSDVAGDPLDAITDPTVPNRSSARDAIEVLRAYGLWDSLPESIRRTLTDPRRRQPDLSASRIHSELLVTGEAACEAMSAEASLAGAQPAVLGTGLEADAVALGSMVGQIAAESATLGRPFPPPTALLGCGGESTVRLEDGVQFGRGGPNREAALAAARRISGLDVAAVFLDTDGADGGGEAAGAVVDGQTMARAARAGVDVRDALASHTSGDALEALDDGIETGPTHTNVNDLFAIAIGGGCCCR